MNWLLLALCVVTNTSQNILKKQNARIGGSGPYFFSAVSSAVATVFFAVCSTWSLPRPELLVYTAAVAVTFVAAHIFSTLAMQYGSLANTALVLSYALFVPAAVGLLFWNEPMSPVRYVGLALMLLSLFLTNYVRGQGKQHLSAKWAVCALLAFAGNGFCSVFMRLGQQYIDDPNQMMAMALVPVTLVLVLLTVRHERATLTRQAAVRSGAMAMPVGLFIGATNLLVLLLNERMPASVLFPVIAVGGLILTFVFSALVYREKSTPAQTVGFWIGVVSVLLLTV